MNAEQPAPLITPTRFLLECNTGWPFPPVNDDPFNRCSPLTPPLSSQQPQQQQEGYPQYFGGYIAPSAPVKRPPTPPSTFVPPTSAVFPSPPHPMSNTVEVSSPLSPKKSTAGRKRRASEDDDDDEQRQKLLERNRLAASKCRQKKKRWVQDLEVKSEQVSARNQELHDLLAQLREESMFLRNQLLAHGDCNCTMVQTYLRRSSARLTTGPLGHPTDAAADAVAELMSQSPSSTSSHRSSPTML
ncbi:hypothetical protein BJV82DRAFT_536336 [Fennellomyces sp. T-0311]|nr:hypothetical protein BJV82DRAFT_536336 [Fennellomyces sp. T-0311]